MGTPVTTVTASASVTINRVEDPTFPVGVAPVAGRVEAGELGPARGGNEP